METDIDRGSPFTLPISGENPARTPLNLTFPVMPRLRPEQRWRALLVAVLGGLGATHFIGFLLFRRDRQNSFGGIGTNLSISISPYLALETIDTHSKDKRH